MFRSLWILLAAISLSANAWAGDLVVKITTPDGKPLSEAVVMLPAGAGAPKPAFPWKLEIEQRGKQFQPFVLIVPVGGSVAFPNLDKYRHHVYSFSKGNKFELELYGRGDKRVVPFNAAGVAALGCNIHDQMVAFIRIVDTPWAAKSGATGEATIKGAPAGKTQVTLWHPYAKTKDQSVVVDTVIGADITALHVVLDVSARHAH